jgi:glyoxylase-like metal-dependent hydrolase (beta-lactamase superfamily II)
MHRPDVFALFDPRTYSIQYVVSDPQTKACAIIDPVLDFDEKSGSTATHSADALLEHVRRQDLRVHWILDTHPHADHFSAAAYLKRVTGAPMAIGAHVVDVQKIWSRIYNWPDLHVDGSQWDRLFSDGETFFIGDIKVDVMYSPGHTLASITYVAGDAAFVHDTLFMPDSGTARADFPGGSANALWSSIQAILSLPEDTRIFVGHDYQPEGRAPLWESTVQRQKAENIHLRHSPSKKEFITLREKRDRTLPMPKLILHALQVNINGGQLPKPEANGMRYLKLPMGTFPNSVWS